MGWKYNSPGGCANCGCGGSGPGTPVVTTPGCPCATSPASILVTVNWGGSLGTQNIPMAWSTKPAGPLGRTPPGQTGYWSEFTDAYSFSPGVQGYWNLYCSANSLGQYRYVLALYTYDAAAQQGPGRYWLDRGAYWIWGPTGIVCNPWGQSGGAAGGAFPAPSSATAATAPSTPAGTGDGAQAGGDFDAE